MKAGVRREEEVEIFSMEEISVPSSTLLENMKQFQ